MNFGVLGGGILLGLGAAAPIGPVNLEIARRTLRQGFWAGFALGCGAVTVDVAYAVLTSMSVRPALNHPRLLQGMGLCGGAVLAYLGVMSLRSTARPHGAAMEAEPAARAHTHYVTGLLMTSLNPMTLLFWFIAVPGSIGQIAVDPRRDLPWACAGVFIAALGWVCSFSGLMAVLGRRKKEGWLRAADLAGGILLLGFASLAIWRSVGV